MLGRIDGFHTCVKWVGAVCHPNLAGAELPLRTIGAGFPPLRSTVVKPARTMRLM